jgi:GNAT superfamily N-acetyltransferase
MQIEVTTYYLEMKSPGELLPKRSPRQDVSFVRVATPMPELNRFLYTAVGGDWWWIDRLSWTYQRWFDYLNRAELETWLLCVAGVPAGYCELETQAAADVEVAYFGVLPQWIGQGLGGHLLTGSVERAWAMGARRVWLHTCTLDHPHALAHYQARGFRIYRHETKLTDEPDVSPGPWPGAR